MSSAAERNEAMFAALISGYATQAMVGLGKIANPITGKVERDLEQARAMIDILEMLEAKTEGNRSDAETDALRQALSMLRLNFVDEVNRSPDTEATDDTDSASDTDTATASETDAAAGTGNGEDRTPDADASAEAGGADDDPSAERVSGEA